MPFGMSGRKKLSDYLIDKKVSMAEKSRQFVMLSGDDVVWVVGRRLDDRYAIVLVGLNDKQLKELPKNIIGIKRTMTK